MHSCRRQLISLASTEVRETSTTLAFVWLLPWLVTCNQLSGRYSPHLTPTLPLPTSWCAVQHCADLCATSAACAVAQTTSGSQKSVALETPRRCTKRCTCSAVHCSFPRASAVAKCFFSAGAVASLVHRAGCAPYVATAHAAEAEVLAVASGACYQHMWDWQPHDQERQAVCAPPSWQLHPGHIPVGAAGML